MTHAAVAADQAVTSTDIRALALRAFDQGRAAVSHAARAVATGEAADFDRVGECERELDLIEKTMDEQVGTALSGSAPAAVRELLTGFKVTIDLERLGDLVLSFANRSRAVGTRLGSEDLQDLLRMATTLERMVGDLRTSFAERDLNRALAAIRADGEIDRVRNLIFLRHIESQQGHAGPDSIQVLFMAQALERAGDHAKNVAEDIIHALSGRTVKHLLRDRDKSYEQLFLDWIKQHSK